MGIFRRFFCLNYLNANYAPLVYVRMNAHILFIFFGENQIFQSRLSFKCFSVCRLWQLICSFVCMEIGYA